MVPTVPLKLGCWTKSVIVTWSPMWRTRPCLSAVGSGAVAVGGCAVAGGEDAAPEEEEDDVGTAAAWWAADSFWRQGVHNRLESVPLMTVVQKGTSAMPHVVQTCSASSSCGGSTGCRVERVDGDRLLGLSLTRGGGGGGGGGSGARFKAVPSSRRRMPVAAAGAA